MIRETTRVQRAIVSRTLDFEPRRMKYGRLVCFFLGHGERVRDWRTIARSYFYEARSDLKALGWLYESMNIDEGTVNVERISCARCGEGWDEPVVAWPWWMWVTTLGAALLLAVMILLGCASPRVREGERIFAGCVLGVDDRATKEKGEFVCKGPANPAPFGGNGRSCGSCHMPGDGFGLSVKRIATLPSNHPLFFPGLDEDLGLLRTQGLIHVIDQDKESLDEFRQTPKLVHLQRLCSKLGDCAALGLLGDRETNLCAFSREAVANHLSKSVKREPGVDFRLPNDAECDALVAFMLSDRVASAGR